MVVFPQPPFQLMTQTCLVMPKRLAGSFQNPSSPLRHGRPGFLRRRSRPAAAEMLGRSQIAAAAALNMGPTRARKGAIVCKVVEAPEGGLQSTELLESRSVSIFAKA